MTYYKAIKFILSIKIINWYIIDIILITFFAHLILKAQIYRHQYLSIVFIVVSGLILNGIHSKFEGIRIFDIIVNLFGDSIYSLMIILKRYSMVTLFCSAYEIVFYEGIFSLIFFIILLIIFTNFELNDINELDDKRSYIYYNEKYYMDNFFDYIHLLKTNKEEILIFVITMLYYIPYYIFFNLTIKNNSVFHVLLILLAEEDLLFEYDSSNVFMIFMNILLTIIILFMFMVFIEIIELNFCGFSNNLKRNISLRAETEAIINDKDIENNQDNRDLLVEMDGQTIDFNNQSN